MCGIAWHGDALAGTALPTTGHEALLTYLRSRFPDGEEGRPPESIDRLIRQLVRWLSGEAITLDSIPIAFAGASVFERRVYAATSAIPLGETRTYGQLAASLGEPGAARAIGRALGRNPVPIVVPCHRVLAANGRSGGFSAPGGVATKMKLLDIERARRSDQPSLFDLRWAARG
jgi:methylated-DNA-[protein]-cysteine S-methyltransferase